MLSTREFLFELYFRIFSRNTILRTAAAHEPAAHERTPYNPCILTNKLFVEKIFLPRSVNLSDIGNNCEIIFRYS